MCVFLSDLKDMTQAAYVEVLALLVRAKLLFSQRVIFEDDKPVSNVINFAEFSQIVFLELINRGLSLLSRKNWIDDLDDPLHPPSSSNV